MTGTARKELCKEIESKEIETKTQQRASRGRKEGRLDKNELLKEKEVTENEIRKIQKQTAELQKQLNILNVKQQRLIGQLEFITKKLEEANKEKKEK
ncbi:hypothetical protein ES702_05984 [subsurface metagenome]